MNCLLKEVVDIFNEWFEGILNSYLLLILSYILSFEIIEGELLVDLIDNKVGVKGIGLWIV